ncbi:TcmI family type II polyketide cyclase [Quadrisphaera sp. DSM 44207]|uniref:TcmI family type II polyketide cyclase n=1 Tax=Quadrisphaera sp. DSM 44207 TaxID=1881057 RepID=UPI0008813FCB|nr:TcmI family type II polyketide cyclase [Quadrisphaera sp. DSM 44207]SDQ09952.1 cyclase [Quadrisphaera sp. DSM 44207]
MRRGSAVGSAGTSAGTSGAGSRTGSRTVIVARIAPGAEPDVARVFAESDRTDLPQQLGVTERSLYSLGDAYVHLVEFDRSAEEAMAVAVGLPGFRDVSAQLQPHISPYLATWRSPADAQARCFYTYRPGSGPEVLA